MKGNAKGPADRLRAGRVGRAHGLDGSFYVTGAEPRLLKAGANVQIDGKTSRIVRRAGTDQRPIVRLEHVEDRAGAQALHRLTLTVAPRDAPKLAPGEWWAHQLEGLLVLDGAREIGTVVGLLKLPSCEALEVRARVAGESVLVPMVKDAIRSVDLDAGRIEVNMDFVGE